MLMQNIFSLGQNLGLSRLSRLIDYPLTMPTALLFSLTNECYSKCKTCNIWKVKNENPNQLKKELDIYEWKKIIKNIGTAPYWISVTGGEPFLRKDLRQILSNMVMYNQPRYLSIATSGIYPKQIFNTLNKVLVVARIKKTSIFVNVSLDDIDEEYEKIRGINAYKSVKKTIEMLHDLKTKYKNLVIGINLTLSGYNNKRIKYIHENIFKTLKPDSFICEIEGSKKSLNYQIPKYDKKRYLEGLDFLLNKKNQVTKEATIVAYLRKKYYSYVRQHILFDREILKCHAGYAFCFVAADGNVKLCSVRDETLGNLREYNYNFRQLWFSKKPNSTRQLIKKEKCHCSDSGANYLNLMINGI